MAPVIPLRRRPRQSNPPEMQARAMDNLRFIRGIMESAATFTAVSGWGQVLIGLTAILATFVAARQSQPWAWVATWVAEAGIGAGLSVASMAVKSHAANVPLLSGPMRKLILTFSPAMLVGAVLTGVFIDRELYALLPGSWLLLYGAAVVSAGTNSVRIVPVMGAAFMAVGAATFLVSQAAQPWMMLAGFGGLHIVFGLWIARKHGG
jgi:hypothetical protein